MLRAGMEPEPTRGLMRSPTELMEGEPNCSSVRVFRCACVCVCLGVCAYVCVYVCV